MMIGVAQVIGIKPTLRSFFSIGPAAAKTSLAGDNVLIAFVLTLDGRPPQLSCGIAVVLRLTDMATASAAAAVQRTRGVEWVTECGHSDILRWTGRGTRQLAFSLQSTCQAADRPVPNQTAGLRGWYAVIPG